MSKAPSIHPSRVPHLFRNSAAALMLALLISTLNCRGQATTPSENQHKQYPAAPKMTIDTNKHYTAIIDTSRGKIVCELFPKAAPITVNSFVFLARDGFFNGLTFHRIENFCIQGGDPNGDGTGGPGYTIPDEVKDNPHQHVKGALAMANAGPNTNGSQFFILKTDSHYLDGGYTVFGQVTQGQDIVNKMEKGDVIKSITIEEK